jgi:glycosyltransferase involved in cell wall biosynthesis
VVDVLARGLHAQGHDVHLFTVGESTCPVPRTSWYAHPAEPMGSAEAELAHALAAYDQLPDVDVVHDHTLAGPLVAAQRRPELPVVTTNHGRFTPDTRVLYAAIARTSPVIAISHDQRARRGQVPVAAVIHHGLDLAQFRVGRGCGGYLAFVGRMSPDKGAHVAIEIARRCGVPLLIAAKMRAAAERAYFDEQVAPRLGPQVEFLGELSTDERTALMGGALALLNPILWPEPFGLTVVEAQACGTPVVSYAAGAATETVDHGRTGFLVSGVDEAARAVAAVPSLDRRHCRAAVAARFSMERMAADHVRLYRAVASVPRPRDVDPVPGGPPRALVSADGLPGPR